MGERTAPSDAGRGPVALATVEHLPVLPSTPTPYSLALHRRRRRKKPPPNLLKKKSASGAWRDPGQEDDHSGIVLQHRIEVFRAAMTTRIGIPPSVYALFPPGPRPLLAGSRSPGGGVHCRPPSNLGDLGSIGLSRRARSLSPSVDPEEGRRASADVDGDATAATILCRHRRPEQNLAGGRRGSPGLFPLVDPAHLF